ncbi:MAG: murein tripeptide amidase MpaA [Fibrobacter sp.]|jgi:protein MpaA|nr:murein tripeptide amidase MpaA [Fibrobacter sp.]
MNREQKLQGRFAFETERYGTSAEGAPLHYFPCEERCRVLVVAGIHGEEADTTFLLSRAMRFLLTPLKSAAAVLCANPDGMAKGLRANANGVDLNRNFPASNWKPENVLSRWTVNHAPAVELSPGAYPGSEKETAALLSLIEALKPETILAVHSPLACVDCSASSALAESLEKIFELPRVKDIGYPTPGSLGSWCGENNLECITLELPALPAETLAERYAEAWAEWLNLI